MQPKTRIALIICVTVMILGLAGAAVYVGAESILSEIVSAVVGIIIGVLGSFGIKRK